MKRKKKLTPRKQATQGRSRLTVKSIIEATTRIIEKSGVEDLSTNHIAKIAGVSIGSLYQYFPSKDSILLSLVETELNQHVQAVKQQIEQMEDVPLENFIDEMLTTILEMLERKKRVRYFLFKFMPRGLMSSIHQVEDEIQEIFYHKLKTYPELSHIENLNMKSYIMVHATIGVILSNLAPQRSFDVQSIHTELKQLIQGYLLYP